jgi:hypothetical protein
MKTIINFIDVWGNRVVFLLVLVIFMKTCSTNGKVDKVSQRVDSLEVKLTNDIKIEGLKSEKRMIQSTDRKILDVQRQTEIDKELNKLINK